MTDKKAYAPGDIASFLASKSTAASALKEQGQLQALFEKKTESKLPKKSAKVSTDSQSEVKTKKAGKKNDALNKSVEQALAAAAHITSLLKGGDKKSRKRSLSEIEPSSQGDIDESPKAVKRFKKGADVEVAAKKSSTETTPKEDKKQHLTKNEMNAQRRVTLKEKKEREEEIELKNKRTVFVGNVAMTVTKKTLTNLFKEFGKVEAVRFRSAPVARMAESNKGKQEQGSDDEDHSAATKRPKEQTKMSRKPTKVLVIMKQFDSKRHCMNAYVVFETEESAQNSLQLNGTELDGFHIRVDMACVAKKRDHKSSIFVGNLPFDIEEEDVRKHFEPCGEIENVRIIRDKFTRVGKGFGYVKFMDLSSVKLAIAMNDQELRGRPLRVKKAAKKQKKKKSEQTDPKKERRELKKTIRKAGKNKAKKLKRAAKESGGPSVPTTKKSDVVIPPKKPGNAPKTLGAVNQRLQKVNTRSETGRKIKQGLKKTLRDMLREKKKQSLGKMLTGEK